MTEPKPSTMKPCPFCGGPGKHVHQRWSGRAFHGVTCDGDCGTFFDCRERTEGAAIEAWNTRAFLSPGDGERGGLVSRERQAEWRAVLADAYDRMGHLENCNWWRCPVGAYDCDCGLDEAQDAINAFLRNPTPAQGGWLPISTAPNAFNETYFLVRPKGLHPARGVPFIPTVATRMDDELFTPTNHLAPLVWSRWGDISNGPTTKIAEANLEWTPFPEAASPAQGENELVELVAALRSPSAKQDGKWFTPKATYATKPRAMIDAAADAIERLAQRAQAQGENTELVEADREVERIMAMSDEDILAECRAGGEDPEIVAAEMRARLALAQRAGEEPR